MGYVRNDVDIVTYRWKGAKAVRFMGVTYRLILWWCHVWSFCVLARCGGSDEA